MKQLWKRNAVVGTILVFVCAAIFLNGKYAEKVDKPTKVLGQSELVSTDGDAAEVSANAEGKDYFASARLTRQQARDSALSLLKEASENDDVDAETASEAAKSIETLASYTLSEAQIENMVTRRLHVRRRCERGRFDGRRGASDRGHRPHHGHRQAGDGAQCREHQDHGSKLAVVILGKR